MQPLSLTLRGFRGIRDGLGLSVLTLDFERLADGAQLVAIAGANGRGKTTVMDNMHPYLTMPSRAAVAGPGGFSYYDHVYLPENEKDLIWAHEGRTYRSQVVIRLNGRRRTEAYLFVLGTTGNWQALRLEDGTVSDGKVETYVRCVESICGSAETFFTSVFSAQGKRQLSAYRNAEIKTLLADLLGQEEIRALGLKAAETARLLKAGLSVIRQELVSLDAEAVRLTEHRARLVGASERATAAQAAKCSAHQERDSVRSLQARLLAEREQSRTTDDKRSRLTMERRGLIEGTRQTLDALKAQDLGEQRRLERLQQRVESRLDQARSRRETLHGAKQRCLATLQRSGAVRRAARRLALAEDVLSRREALVDAARRRAQEQVESQGALRMAEHRLAEIEREAGRAALQADDLSRRLGLTAEVPCRGTDLQGQCKLLGDAREAQMLMPSAQGQIARLGLEKAQVLRELTDLRARGTGLSDAQRALTWAEHHAGRARERVSRLAVVAARAGEMRHACAELAAVDQEMAALGQDGHQPDGTETPDESAERQQITEAREAIRQRQEVQTQQARAALDRLDAELRALPQPFDEHRLQHVEQALARAEQAISAAERSHVQAIQDAQALETTTAQLRAQQARRADITIRIARVEAELGGWNLFARCMSNDGLIALAIDDAGPALSGLANDLLLACYGPRFTVSIRTLLETGKGEQKEGFDIVVYDSESDESKSVGLMSGGERVWINECLTRAVALYLAQHSGRRYATLFSDEADGALDPERKRMFMAMKREVLRLGGYEREYFVSQTPELTSMADAVIELETLVANPASLAANQPQTSDNLI
jgi:exonuclease SbcC